MTPPPAVEDASSETNTCHKCLRAALGRRSKSKATPTDSDAVDTSSETLTCNKLIQKLSPKLLRKKKEIGKGIASCFLSDIASTSFLSDFKYLSEFYAVPYSPTQVDTSPQLDVSHIHTWATDRDYMCPIYKRGRQPANTCFPPARLFMCQIYASGR